jgi:CDP-glucose 4,6-dehydratase
MSLQSKSLPFNPSFWNGRSVFLTGHTGFKGSWMALWLQALKSRVTGYALPSATVPALYDVVQVAEGMTSYFGDINNAGQPKTIGSA